MKNITGYHKSAIQKLGIEIQQKTKQNKTKQKTNPESCETKVDGTQERNQIKKQNYPYSKGKTKSTHTKRIVFSEVQGNMLGYRKSHLL